MKAQQHLDEAAGLIGGDRARQHGDVRALHEQVAQLWTAYFEPSRYPLAPSLTAIDVLAMMALLKLARGLPADVVAEGVETPDQSRALARLGCRRQQGYLFARPLPEAALRGWALPEAA